MASSKSSANRLALDGPATVRTAAALQASLRDAIRQHNHIEIDCTGVTEADLTLIQLLLAARKSAERDGKQLTLSAPADGTLREVLEIAGFLPTGDAPVSQDVAFWLEGKTVS